MVLDALALPGRSGLTVLGGEPFEPENQRELIWLMRKVKELYPDKDIWCYTGFTYEKLIDTSFINHCEVTDEMLNLIDILVDGPFILDKRNIGLKFRGSENQRILDLKKARENNTRPC